MNRVLRQVANDDNQVLIHQFEIISNYDPPNKPGQSIDCWLKNQDKNL